ncbi:C6 domain-containing protein, partial [Trichostrongylus colubriformis]
SLPSVACQRCTAAQVSFDSANGDPGRIDSDFRLETNDPATGCLRLTAICTAQAGFFSFMEFNVIERGPAENQNMGQVTEALLECMNGAWFYAGIRQVNSVQCTEAPLP